MIVSRDNCYEIISKLGGEEKLGIDVETTGLFLWKEDRIFSFSLADSIETYYFNFLGDMAHDLTVPDPQYVLDRERIFPLLCNHIFHDKNKILFAHNAKFELAAFHKENCVLHCIMHDTEVGARLQKNDEFSYELEDVAKRAGMEKNKEVEDYITRNKLYEWQTLPGKKTRKKNKKYYKVPFEIMQRYAQQDARLTYDLGIQQIEYIKKLDEEELDRWKFDTLTSVLETERKITHVAFKMEKEGIKIDRLYCLEAISYEDERMLQASNKFKELTGFDFVDSGKNLSEVFSGLNIDLSFTAKGNASFDDKALEKMHENGNETCSEIVRLIQTYRDAQKRANTYFRAFLFHADSNDIVHTNLRQSGTATGRFSCKEPNLQNLSQDEEEGLQYTVRKAFIPKENHIFVMIDYCQMEFRMMLDYAKQEDLIEKIKAGYDPHDATSELTKLDRKKAKTLNFGLLYGMGANKLAAQLKITIDEARLFRAKYFLALPGIKRFLRRAMEKTEKELFTRGWAGRVYQFKDLDFSYKAPNAIIQGGCADVVKRAMIRLDEYLKDYRSKMIMQIHDEILFEIHKDELHIVPQLKEIMETTYPFRYLPLTCSIEHSLKSWGEPVEGLPEDATRNQIQTESKEKLRIVDRCVVYEDATSMCTGNT